MKSLVFNKAQFIKGIFVFSILIAVWTALIETTAHFVDADIFFVSALGFLVIFATALHFGSKSSSKTNFFYLIVTILTLYVSSFIFGFVLESSISRWVDFNFYFPVLNSIFVSFALTFILDKLYGIELKRLTFTVSAILMLFSYPLMYFYGDDLKYRFNLSPGIVMFIFFQSSAVIPLLSGLALKRKFVGRSQP